MIEDKLAQDLKSAMLAHDAPRVSTLRGLKSAILYAKVANGSRDQAMSDEAVTAIIQKESKKRQESAELYRQGGSDEKAAAELAEKAILDEYLPAQLDEAAILAIIDKVITETGAGGPASMGTVIGQVKQRAAGAADGAVIARLVKERLTQ